MEVVQKYLTYQEFKNMELDDHDDAWYELINGEIVKKQSPTYDHQGISREIEYALVSYTKKTKLGVIYHAPLDVVLDDGNAYQPDIFFVKKERLFIFNEKEKIVIGAPDLVIEILSKSTAKWDRGAKRDNYEKYGVREFWLVDPQKRSVEIYNYENERYKLTDYLEVSGILKSTVLEGFEMEIESVFEEAAITADD